MWTAAICARVLRARAYGPGTFDAASYGAVVAASDGVETVAMVHAHGLVRIDVVEGTVREGPVGLSFTLPHDSDFRRRLDAIRSFDALVAGGRMVVARDARLRRAALALRAHDARAAGASLRHIAATLLGGGDWPGAGDCVKSQARRLVASGDRLMTIGPLPLLAA